MKSSHTLDRQAVHRNPPRADPVAVVGTGAMGTGIAQVALLSGHPVILLHRRIARARQAREEIERRILRLADKGRISQENALETVARMSVADELSATGAADLVIESVAEEMTVKSAVLSGVEKHVGPDTVIATNTSSLSVTALAAALDKPSRFAGMHFFNPAPLMALVEVVSAPATDGSTVRLLRETAARWGKTAVHSADRPGFIVNRVARPYYGEALRTLEQRAASPAAVDAALTGSGGFVMGPCALMDLIGHDVNEAVTRGVWSGFHHDPRFTPSLVQRKLVEAGHLGRKTGQGLYGHGPGAPPSAPATCAPVSVPPPTRLRLHGDPGPARQLVTVLGAAGITVERADTAPGAPTAGAFELPDGTLLRLTDGDTAARHTHRAGRPTVLFDLSLDYHEATRAVLAMADGTPGSSRDTAVALFQALGKDVGLVDDIPGLLVFRTVAMLVNTALDAAAEGLADAADIDTAMRLGTNYPLGPVAWGERLGFPAVLALLENLSAEYQDGRYRPAPALRRAALRGTPPA
ncbi:3-hydroxyacyl-CoA dehydrogenase [Streptomyces sp. NPDC002018]|uniref:3-hydroxyacyl-CoA dehydrogenase n=1 Tax=Streptomyces sp. NPDC002018 TaxID=3364629 RepID=UPI0036D015D0